MTKQEILTKAIEKAIANGFVRKFKLLEPNTTDKLTTVGSTFVEATEFGISWKPDNQKNTYRESFNDLIFNHDFAIAIWGNGPKCAYCGEPPHHMHQPRCVEGSNIWPYLWEWHLQKMVIADDPIAYLGDHLDD